MERSKRSALQEVISNLPEDAINDVLLALRVFKEQDATKREALMKKLADQIEKAHHTRPEPSTDESAKQESP